MKRADSDDDETTVLTGKAGNWEVVPTGVEVDAVRAGSVGGGYSCAVSSAST